MSKNLLQLHPATKALILLTVILLSMFSSQLMTQGILIAFTLGLAFLFGKGEEFLSTFFKATGLLVLFILLMQTYIVPNPDKQVYFAFIGFSKTGFDTSINLSLRIMAISSSVIWFFLVTKVKDIVAYLDHLKVPKAVTFVLASTILLVPEMTKLSQQIMDAQKARGIETEGNLLMRSKAFLPMIGPLVLTAIQQTDERVLTMEARGFSAPVTKTSYYLLKHSSIDWILRFACLVVLVLAFTRGGI
ncbi:energy-coupling factor transporter transmembrane protein EcfT [Atopobacter sp. AH10]|uniref:energy-coupling factor transporter transmembrane component T n=1 Tax=Atopobacter sp. AH10 TaxID=2315861 RepID=UPI000EF24786|nr:energy-coupling factor transporter transmembrane component T [Atopobacter sp. AH10]RLK63444.1 energy-coupling factor transporter transmembrane protein EcfT [Atopobacter sp. AH10]